MRFGTATITEVGNESKSFCFYWASELTLHDLPSLEVIEIGCNAFSNISTLSVSSASLFGG